MKSKLRQVGSCANSGGTPTHHKMQNQGDDREYQQQVNESTCYVEHGESAKPCDQQYYKQDRPDAHYLSPRRLASQPLTALAPSGRAKQSVGSGPRSVITGHLVAAGLYGCTPWQ